MKNSTCGDQNKIYIIVQFNKIIDFKYEGESCIYSQASASLLSRSIVNKKTNKIKSLLLKSNLLFKKEKNILNNEWKSILKLMNKSNISRKECLLLPIKATQKALKIK
jgi:NifU homolog involved in Fe-S cluster formation